MTNLQKAMENASEEPADNYAPKRAPSPLDKKVGQLLHDTIVRSGELAIQAIIDAQTRLRDEQEDNLDFTLKWAEDRKRALHQYASSVLDFHDASRNAQENIQNAMQSYSPFASQSIPPANGVEGRQRRND
jgi:hypothetical protein